MLINWSYPPGLISVLYIVLFSVDYCLYYASTIVVWVLFEIQFEFRRTSLVAQTVKCLSTKCGRPGFYPWVGKICWKRKWQSTPVLLPGKSHGQMSLISYNPWGHKESDTTERLHFTSFKFRESDTSSFVLYSQDCFGSSRSFLAPCCFRIFLLLLFYLCENTTLGFL